ncbi:hypothetical protein MKHDV_03619 [Halodesulfovibrio sp. MK-HDV]|nr:hypothetical protein MKHDV_03619 [Halodesulfovibrio sp. MK-HDV]
MKNTPALRKKLLRIIDKKSSIDRNVHASEYWKEVDPKAPPKVCDDLCHSPKLPNELKKAMLHLISDGLVTLERAPQRAIGPTVCITAKGIDYVNRPCWPIWVIKKSIENSSIKDLAWLIFAIAFLLYAAGNYIQSTRPTTPSSGITVARNICVTCYAERRTLHMP